jgi:hypothetical protein
MESCASGRGAYVPQIGRNNRVMGVTCQEQYIYIEVILWSVIDPITGTIRRISFYRGRGHRPATRVPIRDCLPAMGVKTLTKMK